MINGKWKNIMFYEVESKNRIWENLLNYYSIVMSDSLPK
jgi:hypothetical protein